jgi:hypothetical protein
VKPRRVPQLSLATILLGKNPIFRGRKLPFLTKEGFRSTGLSTTRSAVSLDFKVAAGVQTEPIPHRRIVLKTSPFNSGGLSPSRPQVRLIRTDYRVGVSTLRSTGERERLHISEPFKPQQKLADPSMPWGIRIGHADCPKDSLH